MVKLCDEIIYASDGDVVYTDEIYSADNFDNLTVREIRHKDLQNDYIESFNSDKREIYHGVIIYFPSDVQGFLYDSIVSQSILEETFAEGQTPLGAVSSNELDLIMYNEDKKFSPLYASGQFYGKLTPNVQVDSFVGIKIADGTIHYVHMGEFFTTNWNSPNDSLESSVICNDTLLLIGNKALPQIPIQESCSIQTMFETLFLALGLTDDDYDIDELNYSISIAAFEGNNVFDALQYLADRGLCLVFGTREGKIKVLRGNNIESYSYTWQDSDVLINSDIPVNYSNIYSQCEISYTLPKVGAQTSVLTIENVEIPSGGLDLDNLSFSSTVGAVESVNLIGSTNSYIDSITIGARSISISLQNPGSSETVIIEIYGKPIDTFTASYTNSDSTAQALIGNIKLPINNPYIQSKSDAVTYASKIIELITDPAIYFTFMSFGNPYVSLLNTIRINDIINSISNIDYIPIRMSYIVSNGLDCNGVMLKKDIRSLM